MKKRVALRIEERLIRDARKAAIDDRVTLEEWCAAAWEHEILHRDLRQHAVARAELSKLGGSR